MSRPSNPNRIIPCHTLYPPCRTCLFLYLSPNTRRKLRMTPTSPPRKWRFRLLHLPLPPRRARTLLWILYIPRNLKHRHHLTLTSNNNSLHRICPPMRPNKVLRSNSNYKPPLGHPIFWKDTSRMSMRRIRSRQCHTHSFLCNSFSNPIHYCRHISSTYFISSPIRIKQPPRPPIRDKKSPLSPLLHNKRPSWIYLFTSGNHHHRSFLPKPPYRPRKLHPCKSFSHPSTYYTRMIFSMSLRHPTINPKQTRRSYSNIRRHSGSIPNSLYKQQPATRLPILTTSSNHLLNFNCNPHPPNLNRRTTSRSPI